MVVAAYRRIADELRAKINSRDIKPGGQLPSELELRDHYMASRNTVLDAIRKLKDEGLVETKPGMGWFARIQIVPFVNSIEWEDVTASSAAKALGRTPRATPPIVSRQAASADMSARLDVPLGTEMVIRRQAWYLDEVPWKIEATWCPKARVDQGAQRLLVAEDIDEGVGDYLRTTLRLRSAGSAFFFLPRAPSDDEARFFEFPPDGAMPYVVELIRTAIAMADGSPWPLYATAGIYAGDRNRFESGPATGSTAPAGLSA
jgi:GntR family transcriptional regulator